MKTLVRDTNGESLIWWSWQNLAKPGQSRNARAWLHFYDNCLGIQWVFKPKTLSFYLTFADHATDDNSLSFSFSLPYLLALYVNIERVPFVTRLPGVKWRHGDYYSGEREISLVYDPRENNWIHWRLWRDPSSSKSHDWRDDGLFVDNLIFGKAKYSKTEIESRPIKIEMAEGVYDAMANHHIATWTRKRWCKPKSISRVEIEVKGGVPVPGDGENSWDIDDDAVESMTVNAETIEEAIVKFKESILRDRGER